MYFFTSSKIYLAMAMASAGFRPWFGIAGYAAGLLLSALFDLPSGAAIVWTMALIGGITALMTKPRKDV